jgi:hypothetical protein
MSVQESTYRNRRAVSIEDERLRVTLSVEGCHIAEIFDKTTGVNPLWSPPWPSIEPSTYLEAKNPEYGCNSESQLLAGILGHNLCVDIFGPPSAEEYAAGITVHGEGSILPYTFEGDSKRVLARMHLPIAQLDFEREAALAPGGVVRIREKVTNLTGLDRPIAWTQHVTLGPPFIENGKTRLHVPARRSAVYPSELGADQRYVAKAEFEWPHAPNKDGSTTDLSVFPAYEHSCGVTAHLVDTDRETGYFLAWHPETRLAVGYAWKRSDFPWISLWEENRSRTSPPWNGVSITRGVEFGASPWAEGRRGMIDRARMFDTPVYRWLPARASATVEYSAFSYQSTEMPVELPAQVIA